MSFKEFFLVFYGAAWLPKTRVVAAAINTYMETSNPSDDSYNVKVEVFYISNDRSESEFDQFMQEMNEQRSWCYLPWNDDKQLLVKEKYCLDSLPRVIVLDKNLEIVTENGVDDLLFLTPTACRSYWIEILTAKKKEEQDEDE